MKKKQGTIGASLALMLLLGLLVSGCSNSESTPIEPSAAEPVSAASEDLDSPNNEYDLEDGMKLEGVDVCMLLPRPAIEAIIGVIRDEVEPTLSIDREVGCRFINADGVFFEVQLYPLDQWALAEITLLDAESVPGVGAGAYVGTYTDAITLKGLIENEVVISVHVGDSNLDTAIALFNIMADNLP
ncbi:MAG: hypothetical protein JXA97_00320 [Anaerolineales bacterium]|nr:hypothetical protein [Anaerolineales bacterium]